MKNSITSRNIHLQFPVQSSAKVIVSEHCIEKRTKPDLQQNERNPVNREYLNEERKKRRRKNYRNREIVNDMD
jgi:hypothetical protein